MRGVVTALPKLDRSRRYTTTVCYRWRDAGQEGRGGLDRGGEVRDGVKITQSYKRLAVGEKCNTAEENGGRQDGGTERDMETERTAIETFRPVDSFL